MATYRSGDRTRRELLEAAERLFFERGYHAVTLADIAKQADAAKGSVLYHFGSKAQVLAAVVEPVVADYNELSSRLQGLDRQEAQTEAIAGYVDLVMRHRRAAKVVRNEIAQLLQDEAMAGLRESGAFLPQALCGGRTDEQASVTALFVIQGVTGAVESYTDMPDDRLRQHLVGALTATLKPLLHDAEVPSA